MLIRRKAIIAGIALAVSAGQLTANAAQAEIMEAAPIEGQSQAIEDDAAYFIYDLSAAEAQTAALKDAKLKESEISLTKNEIDTENGVRIHDIEFNSGGYKYGYEIAVSDGKILKKEKEIITKPTGSGSLVGIEAAKKAAFDEAEINPQNVTLVKAEQDDEDGRTVYEVEFTSSGAKYEYEIDGLTGTIFKWDKNFYNAATNNGQNSSGSQSDSNSSQNSSNNDQSNGQSGTTTAAPAIDYMNLTRTMMKGEDLELSEYVFNGMNPLPARYETSNKKVAKIEGNEVDAKKKGTAVVTAYSADGAEVGKLNLTVIGKTKLKFPKSSLSAAPFEAKKYFKDPAAANLSVKSWSSSNPGVAAIDTVSGMITIKGSGKTTIEAHLYDNDKVVKGKLKVK